MNKIKVSVSGGILHLSNYEGYIDGYVSIADTVYAMVFIPEINLIKQYKLKDLMIL